MMNANKPGLPDYTGPNEGWALWVHHDQRLEYCTDFAGRIASIRREKPPHEHATRLAALTALTPDEIPPALDTARTAYDTARTAYATARTAYATARTALDPAWTAYATARTALDTAMTAYATARTALDTAKTAYDTALAAATPRYCYTCQTWLTSAAALPGHDGHSIH